MKVLHLLVAGNIGGIEVLMKNYAMQSDHDNIFAFVWAGGPVADELDQKGIPVIVLNKEQSGTVCTLKQIIEICRKENVDVVVSHHSAPLLKIALICAKLAVRQIEIITYAHANAYDICEGDRKRGLLLRKLVHHAAMQMADGVIAISRSVESSLREYLHIRRPIRIIYNGVPVKTFQMHSDAVKQEHSMVYIGRLTKEKGVQTTIEALAKIRDMISFVFYIVGDGAYRETLENLAAEKSLQDQVVFLGTRTDVASILSGMEFFIHMPEWEEGFGITIVEAMAAGCICVCSENGAIPEIITNNVDGILVAKGDSEELADKLLELISVMKLEEKQQLRQNAQVRAEQFSAEAFTRSLDDFIVSVAQVKNPNV